MKTISVLTLLVVTVAISAVSVNAQSVATDVKATPAYEVLIVRRAQLKAELVQLQERVTFQHPDHVQMAYELDRLNSEIDKMLRTEVPQISKLSGVYGRLILRQIDLQVQENALRYQFTSTHPELKRKRVEIDALRREIDLLLR